MSHYGTKLWKTEKIAKIMDTLYQEMQKKTYRKWGLNGDLLPYAYSNWTIFGNFIAIFQPGIGSGIMEISLTLLSTI